MTDTTKRYGLALLLLVIGIVWQAVGQKPPVELGPIALLKVDSKGKLDTEFIKNRLAFETKKMAYIRSLPSPYRDFPNAFVLAQSEADYPKIKEAIDRELAASKEIEDAGLGAVPGLVGDALTSPAVWLMAIAAALAFANIAFVLGAGFLVGLIRAAGMELNTLTGVTAEHYLASIVAALIVAAAVWWALQRFWPRPA